MQTTANPKQANQVKPLKIRNVIQRSRKVLKTAVTLLNFKT